MLVILIIGGSLAFIFGIVSIIAKLHKRRKKNKAPMDISKDKQPNQTNKSSMLSASEQHTQGHILEDADEVKGKKTNELLPDINLADPSPQISEESTNTRIEPIYRGGRSRSKSKNIFSDNYQKAGIQREGAKPEVICWKKERQWVIGLEIPEVLSYQQSIVVNQNGTRLLNENSKSNTWILKDIKGEIKIEYSEKEFLSNMKISLVENDCHIFKLGGNIFENGRLVRRISTGWFLVIVPENWKLNENAQARVTGEAVMIPGYKAHCFYFGENETGQIVFQNLSGEVVTIEAKGARFKLHGNRITFVGMEKTPLFGRVTPQVDSVFDEGWTEIKNVVVGEEGSFTKRWRTQFVPQLERNSQDLPIEIFERKCGWYYLRLYDHNLDLVESHDFKFLGGVTEFNVSNTSLFPFTDGHKTMDIKFVADEDLEIKLEDGPEDSCIVSNREFTIITIQPNPDLDEVKFRIQANDCGRSIVIPVLVEKIWFNITDEADNPSQWRDRVIVHPRSEFTATSKKALWLKFPIPGWIKEVQVGFDIGSGFRTYQVKTKEKTISIPLRDFCDSEVVTLSTEEHSLKARIEYLDRIEEGIVLIVPAEETPKAPKLISAPKKKVRKNKIALPSGYFERLTIQRLNELQDGEYVDHNDFVGVGYFRGIVQKPDHPGKHFMQIAYADSNVFVELHNLSLVRHYVISSDHPLRVKTLKCKKNSKKSEK